MTTLLALAILLQDSEVEKLIKEFYEKQPRARTPDETRRLARDVKEKLDGFVKSGKEVARASFHAGEMCLFLEETSDALARFKAAIAGAKDLSKDLQATARFVAGELCLQENDPAGARAHFGEFVASHADDPRLFGARVMTELSHAMEGKPETAVEGLRKLREEHKGKPSEWQIVAAIAGVWHFAERPAEGRAALEEILQSCPQPDMSRAAKATLENQLSVGKNLTFKGRDSGGVELDLERLRGRVVIVYFYSIFEQRAPLEAAAIRKTIRGLDKDVVAIGVCLDRRAEDFDRFRKDLNVTWFAIHEKDGYDGKIAQACGVRGFPHLLILDRKGKVRFFNPFLTMAATETRLLVEKLVAEK